MLRAQPGNNAVNSAARRGVLAASCLLLALCCVTAHAQDNADSEEAGAWDQQAWGEQDDAEGFADTQTPTEDASAQPTPTDPPDGPSPFTFSGFQRLGVGLWVERTGDNPLASVRPAIELQAGYRTPFEVADQQAELQLRAAVQLWYDFAYLHRRDSYGAPTLDAYEWGLLPREIVAAVRLGGLQLSVGRQVVNWGQSEVLSLLDLQNPRDLREPGLTPPQEVRVPVLMSHADLALDRLRLQLVVVHENSFGLLPPPLSEFSPLRALLRSTPALGGALQERQLRYRHRPSHALLRSDAQQYHARVTYHAQDVDVALHAASMLEPLGIAVLPQPEAFEARDVELPVLHPRFELLGTSASATIFDVLVRLELAASFQRPVALRRSETALLDITSERQHQLDGLLGLTYLWTQAGSVGLEIAQSYFPVTPGRDLSERFEPLWPVEATRIALRIDQAWLRQRLRAGLVGLLYGIDTLNAWAARAELGFSFSDTLRMQLQYMTYQPTRHFGPFHGLTTHDRLVLTGQWDFL